MTTYEADLTQILTLMHAQGLPQIAQQNFANLYRRYRSGDTGYLDWDAITPPNRSDFFEWAASPTAEATSTSQQLLNQLVCIKLNGGLGTTMALQKAKSLAVARDGLNFLQVVCKQISQLEQQHGVRVPLLFMHSPHTRADCLPDIQNWSTKRPQPHGLPFDFLQHEVPRLRRDTHLPLTTAITDIDNAWAPMGHGDIYWALWSSGLLDRLVALGYRWAFISNIDNLAATIDPALLTELEQRNCEFALEVTKKTAADIKGGTLVRYRNQLTLLERAQVQPENIPLFEQTSVFPVFNTNSLWVRLDALHQKLTQQQLNLPLIVNPKNVDTVAVVQLEIAMGAAIGCFEHTCGIVVPRSRFAPVKTTADLLALRSSRFALADSGALVQTQTTSTLPPVIVLDPTYYQSLDDFEQRFSSPLDLSQCTSLTVRGDIAFGKNIQIVGDVTLRNDSTTPAVVPDGTQYCDGKFIL